MKELKKKVIPIYVYIIAGGVIGGAVFLAAIDIIKNEQFKFDNYVGALLTLTGVIFYFAALFFQIKEYRLQVIELKKSVKAQTRSSIALNEQKNILIEQNTNSLIIAQINNFNEFKQRNDFIKGTINFMETTRSSFSKRWDEMLKNPDIRDNELNENFAKYIKSYFSKAILDDHNYYLLKRYVQIGYNILFFIKSKKDIISESFFNAFFFSQLITHEAVIIRLANLIDSDMPTFTELYWGYWETKEITDWIKNSKHYPNTDFSKLDINELTEHFQKLKQNNKHSL